MKWFHRTCSLQTLYLTALVYSALLFSSDLLGAVKKADTDYRGPFVPDSGRSKTSLLSSNARCSPLTAAGGEAGRRSAMLRGLTTIAAGRRNIHKINIPAISHSPSGMPNPTASLRGGSVHVPSQLNGHCTSFGMPSSGGGMCKHMLFLMPVSWEAVAP